MKATTRWTTSREKRLAGAWEAPAGRVPEFVIIGAQKAGTAFFYQLLCAHPSVVPACAKELHYFDREHWRGMDWYRRCFPERPEGVVSGEASPSYMFDPRVPERLAQEVPNARLIALLRNPVTRAYSHYRMLMRRGREARPFGEAVGAEMDGKAGPNYLSRGHYAEQLERFSRHWGNLLVVKSENLFAGRPFAVRRACRFLGLSEFEPPPLPNPKKQKSEPMDPGVRNALEEYFAPHNERLYEYLGRDLGW